MTWTRTPRPAKQLGDYTPRPRAAACVMEGVVARAVVAVPKPVKLEGARTCRKAKGGCGARFKPQKATQEACGVMCALAMAAKKRAADDARRAREERAADRATRERMKTLPQLLAEAQKEFNRWVRLRDHGQLCISCSKPQGDESALHAGRDCGHYRSVGSAKHLRFHEDNAHAQCVHCNQHLAGNVVGYRLGLIARIGQAAVEALECNNVVRKWTRDEVRAIRDDYRARANLMEKTLKGRT